nr:Gag-Pol polyprotein [Tanacetum cinerariifolium]
VTWHQKLGHMSEQGMKILVERKLIRGLIKVYLPFCEYCVISRQHRLKFKASNSRSIFVLELVYSDVWQIPVQSLGGEKYFASFIDDYSRRCWAYPIKKKSDVFEVFKAYKARVELDSRKKIKCLRTDNEGEYTDIELDTFCRQEGIKSGVPQAIPLYSVSIPQEQAFFGFWIQLCGFLGIVHHVHKTSKYIKNDFPKLAVANIALALSNKVLFIRSATPLC